MRRPSARPGDSGDHGRSRRRGPATTAEILLEAAYLRAAGDLDHLQAPRAPLGSSARFERGVDPEGCAGVERPRRGAHGGRSRGRPWRPNRSTCTPRRSSGPHHRAGGAVNALLGTGLTAEAIPGCSHRWASRWGPTRRALRAVRRPAAHVPPRPGARDRRRGGGRPADRPRQHPAHAARPATRSGTGLSAAPARPSPLVDALVGAGLAEAVTISLVAADAVRASGTRRGGRAANPLRAEESVLRPLIRTGLLHARAATGPRPGRRRALRGRPRLPAPTPETEPLPSERDTWRC